MNVFINRLLLKLLTAALLTLQETAIQMSKYLACDRWPEERCWHNLEAEFTEKRSSSWNSVQLAYW